MLGRNTYTTELFINNQDTLTKIKLHSELATNGSWVGSQVITKEFYPAIPYFSNQIHLGIYNNTGATQSVYVKLWYSAVMLSRDEMMGLLTNAGVP